jgi:hypothetical protein
MRRTAWKAAIGVALGLGCGSGNGTTDAGGLDGATERDASAADVLSVLDTGDGADGGGADGGGADGGGADVGGADAGPDAGPAACVALPAALYASYLGGAAFDQGRDVAFDCEGYLYVAGGTDSADFPATGAAAGNKDVFVTKLAPDGSTVWSVRFGGSGYDRAYALELTADGDVIVAGRAGTAYPTTAGVVQPTFSGSVMPNSYGEQDGFVTRLSGETGAIVWSTYVGGPGGEIVRDVAVDPDGEVYVAVVTDEPLPFISSSAVDTTFSGGEAAFARISADGTAYRWASYLGGSGFDGPQPSIRVDPVSREAVVVFGTGSIDMPTTAGVLQPALGGGFDMFVARYAADGTSLRFGTYLGGSGNDGSETHNVELLADGRVVVGFVSTSLDMTTTAGALQPTHGGNATSPATGLMTNFAGDGYIAILSADGRSILRATYLGGSNGDGVEGIYVDSSGRVAIGGASFSTNYPTSTGAFQTTLAGNADGIFSVLSPDLSRLEYSTYYGGSGFDSTRAVTGGPDGRMALTGESRSPNLPTTTGAVDRTFGGAGMIDSFVFIAVP